MQILTQQLSCPGVHPQVPDYLTGLRVPGLFLAAADDYAFPDKASPRGRLLYVFLPAYIVTIGKRTCPPLPVQPAWQRDSGTALHM
jgi:hypothetical protein